MQKLISLYKPTETDLDYINDHELKDGWSIKCMTSVDDDLILLLEKETRKEKLEKINEL